MRVFRSEFVQNYNTYSFGYAIYAQHERSGDGEKALESGFLPYTGDEASLSDIYYMARSLRLHLGPLELSSENRRVLRKYQDEHTEFRLVDKSAYNWTPEDTNFCLTYARKRFSTDLSPNRLERIRDHAHLTHFAELEINGIRQALLFLHCGSTAWHYWFAFLQTDTQRPLGKFSMLRAAQEADEKNIDYMYLGTCYGKHSLYKVRDFSSISFFDGTVWNTNKKQLKKWCKYDENTDVTDRLKRE